MIKASFYKKYIDSVNKKDRFLNERKHLIDVYSIDPLLVNDVILNLTTGYNYFENDNIKIEKDPEFSYEEEMFKGFEEFKEELIYDGFKDFSEMITLGHFYRLFSPSYYPNF